MVLLLVAASGFPLVPAHAQEGRSRDALVATLLPLEPGTRIRIRTRDGQMRTGALAAVDGDTLRLADGAMDLATVDSLWRGQRATGRGARTGAIAGGIAGALALGLFSAALVEGICETDDCNPGAAALLGGAVGGAAGALSGAGIGALIGSGATTWTMIFPQPGGESPAVEARRSAKRFDAFAVYGIPRALEGAQGAGMGFRVLWRAGRSVSLGGEVAYFGLGEGLGPGVLFPDVANPPFQPVVYRERSRHRLIVTHGALRVGGTRSRTPYLMGTVGMNWYRVLLLEQEVCGTCPPDPTRYPPVQSLRFPGPGGSPAWELPLGYSVGAGMELTSPTSSVRLGVETRWHGRPDFLSIGIAVGP